MQKMYVNVSMGFLNKEQVFLAMALVTAIDAVGGILAYKDKAWLGVILAVMFVPMDASVLYAVSKYDDADHPAPDYSVKQ